MLDRPDHRSSDPSATSRRRSSPSKNRTSVALLQIVTSIPTELPIDDTLPIIDAPGRRSAVVVAPPGSGKTTRVPPAILGSGLLSADHPVVIVLQPRRVAARAAAARIADEQGWSLGEEVGYQVRFERRFSPQRPRSDS